MRKPSTTRSGEVAPLAFPTSYDGRVQPPLLAFVDHHCPAEMILGGPRLGLQTLGP